jgi:hypothetical protein
LYESTQVKGNVKKENVNGETVQPELQQTVGKPKDVTSATEPTDNNLINDADNGPEVNGTDKVPEVERVTGDSSGVNSDIVSVEPTGNSDIRLQPTVQITAEGKGDNQENTGNMNNYSKDVNEEMSKSTQNFPQTVPNKPHGMSESTHNFPQTMPSKPEDNSNDTKGNTENTDNNIKIVSDIKNVNGDIPETTQNAPHTKENTAEDHSNAEKDSDSVKILNSDNKQEKAREESAQVDHLTEKSSTNKANLNVSRDTANQWKDSGIKLPLIKSVAHRPLVRPSDTGSGKKNVSVIQVTKI